MYLIENKPDMVSVLSTLADIIQKTSGPVDKFLQLSSKPMHGTFGEGQGIRRLIPGDRPIIESADWAAVNNASDLWQRLYTGMIKPLKARNFQFIFHLGDVSGKRVFEIDEVLDIIGDYSFYGQVTLILETHEADMLWCKLNGLNTAAFLSGYGSPTAGERYLSLFNTMNIGFLTVLQSSRAIQISRDGQFRLTGPSPMSILGVINARSRFSVGYQLGLLLELDSPHCVAFGLAVSGAYKEPAPGLTTASLLTYIHDWQDILKTK